MPLQFGHTPGAEKRRIAYAFLIAVAAKTRRGLPHMSAIGRGFRRMCATARKRGTLPDEAGAARSLTPPHHFFGIIQASSSALQTPCNRGEFGHVPRSQGLEVMARSGSSASPLVAIDMRKHST